MSSPPDASTASGQRKDRLPGRPLAVVAAVSLAPFLLIAWLALDLQRLVPEVRQRSLAVQELIGRIDYLDEALTSSARLGAATGDPRWERRYDALERDLYATLDRLGGVAAVVDQPQIDEAIAEVADTLTSLERRAFSLARAGELEAATSVLQSPAYVDSKQAYQDRKEALLGGLAVWAVAAEKRLEDRLDVIVALAALSFLILLLVWIVSASLVRRQMAKRRIADARLRAIVDVAPVGIVRVDRDRIVQYWNKAAERIFGWTADEVLGRPYPMTAPQEQEQTDRLFRRGFAGDTIHGMELRRHRKDGSHVHVRMWNAPVRSEEGEIRGLVGIFADVTEQRQLEQRLRQGEKLEAIGRLAGGIAHDFNNVMTAVQGHAELLLEMVSPGDPLRPDIEEIRSSAGRATELTRQLLAFSRRQVLQPRVLELGTVVREIEPMLRRLLGEAIRLEIEEEQGTGRVEADPTQIEQVVVNLAVNARDAMPAGGRLGLRIENTQITERDADSFEYEVVPGPYIRLLVSDTGHGMDEETRRQVFEPFFTRKQNGQGTGLGLATVFGIVKQSGGYIWVESEPGRGTRFEILLPRVEKPLHDAATPVPSTEPEATDPGGETILLVEDDDAVRSLAARVLQSRGYRVLIAASPTQALERLDTPDGPTPDLLVTDVVMPDMNGQALARRVAERVQGVRVIFMSGYTEDEVIRGEIATGTSTFLAKPFSPAKLAAAVRATLDASP